jgi:hypothetical protein
MASIEHLILHIGVPKTGSSLLQKSLRALRQPLRERGIAYVDRKAFLAMPDYRAWAAYGREQYSKEALFDQLRDTVKASRKKVAGGGRTLVISNESIPGRLSPEYGNPFWSRAGESVAELVSVIAPKRTVVIVYVRRQDRLLESLYMQRIHLGYRTKWVRFRDKTCLDERVRFTELIGDVSTVPTVSEVRVRPFEIIQAGSAAFTSDFLDNLGAGDLVHQLEPKTLATTNPSYTQPAWVAALAINRLLTKPEHPDKVRKFLTDLFPPGEYPAAQLLTDEERLSMLTRYRDENAELFATYLPEFPKDAYSTLEGTKAFRGVLTPIPIKKAKDGE